MDFSLQLLPEQPLADLIEVIRLADDLGFRASYSADETYHKDMWILFGAAALKTRRIRFGPEVSGVILRDPTLIAQQAATLDELTDGRAEIVFSIGNFAMLKQYGIRWQGTRPLARLREAHEVMRRFLADGSIDFQGEFYRYSGLFTAARPVQQPMPLKIGAMKGPGSFRLAGEIADGVHVACAHSSEALCFAAENVRAGATRVGRKLDSRFDFCASVLGAISSDSAAAKEAARVAAAFYISSMAPELVERHGIDCADVRPVVDAFARGDVERALMLTTPEIGERLSIAGDPAQWIDRLRNDVAANGYSHVALGLVDAGLVEKWSGRVVHGVGELAAQLELFANHVMPALATVGGVIAGEPIRRSRRSE
jgi:alkanesulfonate monooxygenase SsuD/methylene tetrahydromethanopterin reductase-like flavin-dependent oxidoreductase (luciferase family)